MFDRRFEIATLSEHRDREDDLRFRRCVRTRGESVVRSLNESGDRDPSRIIVGLLDLRIRRECAGRRAREDHSSEAETLRIDRSRESGPARLVHEYGLRVLETSHVSLIGCEKEREKEREKDENERRDQT